MIQSTLISRQVRGRKIIITAKEAYQYIRTRIEQIGEKYQDRGIESLPPRDSMCSVGVSR
jgi:hypothetical protein